jgi:hypothetical protein
VHSKENNSQSEDMPIEWVKIFTNCTSDIGLICRMLNGFQNLNSKITKTIKEQEPKERTAFKKKKTKNREEQQKA